MRRVHRALTRYMDVVTEWLGSLSAFAIAVLVVIGWAAGGAFLPAGKLPLPELYWLDPVYQLIINTTTTIITFVMVFAIQNTTNRGMRALHVKADAQSHAIIAIWDASHAIGKKEDVRITRLRELVGEEDKPEKEIKEDQEVVRDA